jgi:hypothetical protein
MWSEWLESTLERTTLNPIENARTKARLRRVADLFEDCEFLRLEHDRAGDTRADRGAETAGCDA